MWKPVASLLEVIHHWLALTLMVAAFLVVITLASWFTNEVGQVGVGTHGEILSEMPKPGELPDFRGLREHQEEMRRRGINTQPSEKIPGMGH